MNTKAKSNSVITHEIESDGIIVFNVLNAGKISFNPHNTSVENQERAMAHGFIQRISDAAAIPRDTETGKSATADEKFEAMLKLVKHYESGTAEWSRVRESGEGNSGGLLLAALVKMSGKPKEEIRTWMKSQTRTQLDAMRDTDRVKKVIDSIRPAPSISVDTDAMLAEIGIE